MTIPALTLSKHRIEALSDGIFAIVVTLLVLELRPPALPRHAPNAAILRGLSELAMPLFSFFVTFALASIFWLLHHITFHYIDHVNRRLLLIDLAFLMFASLLPFSTSMLGRFHLVAAVPQVIYFSNQFAIALALWFHWFYARRAGLAHIPPLAAAAVSGLSLRIAALPVGAGLAAITALIEPRLAFYAFMVPLLASRIFTNLREKKRT